MASRSVPPFRKLAACTSPRKCSTSQNSDATSSNSSPGAHWCRLARYARPFDAQSTIRLRYKRSPFSASLGFCSRLNRCGCFHTGTSSVACERSRRAGAQSSSYGPARAGGPVQRSVPYAVRPFLAACCSHSHRPRRSRYSMIATTAPGR